MTENQIAPQKKNNKPVFIATIGVVILVVVVIIFTVVIPRTSEVISLISTRQAFTHMGEEISTRLAHSPFQSLVILNALAEAGALTATANFDFRTPSPWEPNVDGQIIFALADEDMLLSGEARVMGLPIDFEAHLNRERLALHSRIIDRNNFYGITFDTFEQDMWQFGHLIGILPHYLEVIIESFTAVETAININAEDAWAQMYINFFVDTFIHMEYTAEHVDLFRGGQDVSVRRTEYVITHQQMAEWLRELLYIFQNDTVVRDQLAIYDNPMLAGAGVPSFSEAVREFSTAIEKFERYYTGTITIALYIGSGSRLVKMTLDTDANFDGNNIQTQTTIDFGESVTDTWRVDMRVTESGSTESVALLWHFDETSHEFENTIEIVWNGQTTATLLSVWNPNTGRFALSMDDGFSIVSFGGIFMIDEDGGFYMQLDTIEIPWMGTLELDITVTPGADIPRIEFINLDQWDWSVIEMIENSILGMLLF